MTEQKAIPRLEVGKWFVTLNLEPQCGRASRCLTLNWYWPRDRGGRLGYYETWYDGPHKSFVVGPINLYWNW